MPKLPCWLIFIVYLFPRGDLHKQFLLEFMLQFFKHLSKAMQIETLVVNEVQHTIPPSINNVKPQQKPQKPTGTYLSNSAVSSGNC